MTPERILDIRDLTVRFRSRGRDAAALRNFSLGVGRGDAVGVAGESGSGKSTAFLAALQLLPESAAVESGSIQFLGEDLLRIAPSRIQQIRGKRIAMVFQDASAALNPYLTIGRQLSEVAEVHERLPRAAARARAVAALGAVSLPDPAIVYNKYPHELSGGQRQRAAIAMAILAEPDVLIADEPTTALDPTLQLEILRLLRRLSRDRSLSLIFISHDLAAVAGLAGRVAVVYAGRVVEEAPAELLFSDPRHPYTRALLDAAIPLAGPRPRKLASIEGAPPPPGAELEGCAFAPRCARAGERCRREAPAETAEGAGALARRYCCFDPVGGGT